MLKVTTGNHTRCWRQKQTIGVYAIFLAVFVFFTSSCTKDYTPKPRGFFRIDMPEKSYVHYVSSDCPFEFDVPAYAEVKKDTNRLAEPCWLYVVFPEQNAQLYITYKSIHKDMEKYAEDSRTMVYKHTVKASAIDENVINNTLHHVHGIMYDIGGNAASNLQFYVTDSSHHFMRASLYFNAPPQYDSLSPSLHFIRADVLRLLNTLKWK